MTRAQYEAKYGQPVASSTGPVQMTREQYNQKYNQQNTVMPQPAEEQPGFLKSMVMATGIPRFAANLTRVGQILTPGGVTAADIAKDPAKPVNMPWLGPVKPVGQEGTFGEKLKDTFGESAKLASTVVPVGGGATQVARATLAGKVGRGLYQGARAGAVGGGLYGLGEGLQQEDATVGSVLGSTAIGSTLGAATGGVLGGVLPLPVAAVQGTKQVLKPSNIMQRVARVNALDQQKFQQTARESIGDYLTKRGIYGNDEEIMTQLANRFTQSKTVADDALSKLPGTFTPTPVKTALESLVEREARVSTAGAPSRNLARVTQLAEKYDAGGLTMSEINEVKRIFERTVKLDYLKQQVPDMVERSNNIDSAIRNWQFTQAKKLGLGNLQEINKETQLARQLLDALGKKNARSGGNNAITLTDWIMLSGGDPTAIASFIAKRGLSSKGVQSAIANKLAGKPTVGVPEAKMVPTIADQATPLDLRTLQRGKPTALPTVKQAQQAPSTQRHNPLQIEAYKNAVEVKLPAQNAPTPELSYHAPDQVPDAIKRAYEAMTGKKWPNKSVTYAALSRIQNEARSLYDANARKLVVNE